MFTYVHVDYVALAARDPRLHTWILQICLFTKSSFSRNSTWTTKRVLLPPAWWSKIFSKPMSHLFPPTMLLPLRILRRLKLPKKDKSNMLLCLGSYSDYISGARNCYGWQCLRCWTFVGISDRGIRSRWYEKSGRVSLRESTYGSQRRSFSWSCR